MWLQAGESSGDYTGPDPKNHDRAMKNMPRMGAADADL